MIVDRREYTELFTSTGCLTSRALIRFMDSSLSTEEKSIVERHLRECNLCADALDGSKLIKNPKDISGIVAEINKNLNDKLARNNTPAKRTNSKILYFSIAATVLILFGFTVFLKFSNPFKFDKIAEANLVESSEKFPPTPIPRQADKGIVGKQKQKTPGKEEIVLNPVNQKNEIIESSGKDEQIIKEGDHKETGSIPGIVPDRTHTLSNEQQVAHVSDEVNEIGFPDIASNQPFEYYLGEVIIRAEIANMEKGSTTIRKKPENVEFDDKVAAESETIQQEKMLTFTSVETTDKDVNAASESLSKSSPQSSSHFFKAVDTMPEFPGGLTAMKNFLKKSLHYPSQAMEKQIEGTIYISFIVEETGKISSVYILRSLNPDCDEVALHVVSSMPDWTPGKNNGKPVRVQINLPIKFQLF